MSDLTDLLLPERARLFHIGLAKTGTTAIQNAASARRAELLEHGVRYPGNRFNHRYPVMGLMGMHQGWRGPGTPAPPVARWDAMMREVAADTTRRILISHEHASLAREANVRRFIEALGPRTHVVITLRGLQFVLASQWQQAVKEGMQHSFDRWLELVLSEQPDRTVTPSFQRRIRGERIVERWARVAGPENVTVVLVDKREPDLLAHAFEAMLGLPRDLLNHAPATGRTANRTLSLVEAELVRSFNAHYDRSVVPWADHMSIVRQGALQQLLSTRVPPAGEPTIPVPAWAAEVALEHSRRTAEALRDGPVRVVGDLDALTLPVTTRDPVSVETVPVDLAGLLLGGMFSAAVTRVDAERQRRRPAAAEPPGGTEAPPQVASVRQAATQLRTSDLARALGVSAFRGLRRRTGW